MTVPEFEGQEDLEKILNQKRLRRAKWHIPREEAQKQSTLGRFARISAYFAVAFSLLSPNYACSHNAPVKKEPVKEYIQTIPYSTEAFYEELGKIRKEYEGRPRLEWRTRSH